MVDFEEDEERAAKRRRRRVDDSAMEIDDGEFVVRPFLFFFFLFLFLFFVSRVLTLEICCF